jgi:hypothetical protein
MAMGQMRFFSPDPQKLTAGTAERAYLAGMEGIPWQSRNVLQRQHLTLERPLRESGNLFIPWQVEHYGEVVLSTASLMESDIAYHLPLELARGTLNRLRALVSESPPEGWSIPEKWRERMAAGSQAFVEAMTSQAKPLHAARYAERCLSLCVPVIDALTVAQAKFLLLARRQAGSPKLSTVLAGALDSLPPSQECEKTFVQAFNSAAITTPWRMLEENAGRYQWEDLDRRIAWSQQQGLRVCLGPLLRLDRASLPDWLYLWEDDFEQLQACTYDFIHALASHCVGRTQIWHLAAGLNAGGQLSLEDDDRLRLAVGAIETLRRVDRQTPMVISFDQPWAEYLAKDDSDLSPLHFADVLHRADLGIAGFGLEINLGYWPEGTLTRDMLEISRQLDRWSYLGLPLLVSLTFPSADAPDGRAWSKSQIAHQQPGSISLKRQQRLVQQLLPLLLAKSAVHGVIWNQTYDSSPHAFPHGGLYDSKDQPKPALASIAELRQEHVV